MGFNVALVLVATSVMTLSDGLAVQSVQSGGPALSGGLAVPSGGLALSDGLAVQSGGPALSDWLAVQSGGPALSGGLAVPSGGLALSDGLAVQSGGPALSDWLAVQSVQSGGPALSGGLAVPSGGLALSDGLAVQSGGPALSGGLAVPSGGLALSDGLAVQSGGPALSGGLAVQRGGPGGIGQMLRGFSNPSLDMVSSIGSPSSQWSSWSGPFGFGTIQRSRTVMKASSFGGIAIPVQVTEDRDTGVRPTIQRTAQLMTGSFMKLPKSFKGGREVGQLIDLLMIIDSSGSIGRTDFDRAKTQLARLVGLLCPQPDPFRGHQQAALLKYSSRVDEIFDFNDKANTNQVQQGIRGMSYIGGSTCTATAFNYATTQMLTPAKGMRARSDVKPAVLILSDGRSNCGGDAIAAAKRLKKKADVYGLMIGDHTTAGKRELTAYVSEPISHHLFAVEGYQDLKKLVDQIESQIGGHNSCSAHFEL